MSPLDVLQAALPGCRGVSFGPPNHPSPGWEMPGAEGRGNRAVPSTLMGFSRGALPSHQAREHPQYSGTCQASPVCVRALGSWALQAPGLSLALWELDQRLLGTRTHQGQELGSWICTSQQITVIRK